MKLVLLGAGGLAQEIYNYVLESSDYKVVAFYTEQKTIDRINTLPVVTSLKNYKDCYYLCAVGDPSLKWKLEKEAIANGLKICQPIVHPKAYVGGFKNVFMEGVVIAPGVSITHDIVIGMNTLVNINSTIGHNTIINSFVTINPGVNISGDVTIGSWCLIGTGACVREKVYVGAGSTVGMGAVVTKDVGFEKVVIGNPARELIK